LLLSIETRVLTQEVEGQTEGKKSGWGRQRVPLRWLQMGTWYAVLSTINKNIFSEKVYKQVYWKEYYKHRASARRACSYAIMDNEFQISSSGNNYTSNKLAISDADAF